MVYLVNEPGEIECLELDTGKSLWKKDLGAPSWSSLLLAGTRLYAADRKGKVYVFDVSGPECRLLAKNSLGERLHASLAASRGALSIRTYSNLWCIQAKEAGARKE